MRMGAGFLKDESFKSLLKEGAQHMNPQRIALILATLWFTTTSARGDIFSDVAYALGYANFNIQGSHNHLSGGNDFLINTTFQGNPLDFGIADLTLQGPISLGLSTGGRGIPEWEFSFQTALSPDGQAVPLNYLLNVDAGSQESQIGGNLLVDGDLSINGFGFYDFTLDYSSRQTVLRSGRMADDQQNFDSDLGPINISGNIFADVLAVVTDPFFQSTNTVNIFDSFSGRVRLSELIAQANSSDSSILDGISQVPVLVATATEATAADGSTSRTRSGSLLGLGANGGNSAATITQVVPEPAIVVLMLVGLPAVLVWRRRSAR